MLKSSQLLLLASLLVDGGTVAPRPPSTESDAGTLAHPVSSSASDAGTVPPPSSSAPVDAGAPAPQPIIAEGIRWPTDVRPLATLDGPAIVAAHAALQRVVASFPKEYAGTCGYSAKALEAVIGQEQGLYFVRVNRRLEKCGRVTPGTNATLDWFELYAVSPEGQVLARYPYHP